MAATELLAVGNSAATGTTVEVTAGNSVAVGLKVSDDADSISPGSSLLIEIEDDDAQWWQAGKLTSSNPLAVLSVPGSYRLRRLAGSKIVGAFRAG